MTFRQQTLYQVTVRNYSPEGTFDALRKDLGRIADLGVSVLYLMPIHPIGVKARKGSMGSPYAISDYRSTHPDMGTLEDFRALVVATHERGMKLIIDVVFHHTAPDHPWLTTHPEYYYLKNGKPGNKVGEWSDIVDLEFNGNPALLKELGDTLLFWMDQGVDGFRFDVASLLPRAFYDAVFPKLRAHNPNVILLAESVEVHFLETLRKEGFEVLDDLALYEYFDILYDYDIYHSFWGYLRRQEPLERYRESLRLQEKIYPTNYVKLRHPENHDNPRMLWVTQDPDKHLNWVAFSFFARGMTMLHAGIETGTDHMPYLFEKDPVDWSKLDQRRVDWLKSLIELKKHSIFAEDCSYKVISHPHDVLHLEYENEEECWMGVFNVGGHRGVLEIDWPEGLYTDVLNARTHEVRFGMMPISNQPVILHQKKLDSNV